MPLRFTGTAKATTAAADIEAASSSQEFINTYSVEFDGTNDYMLVSDAPELSFGDSSTDSPFSISAWIYNDVVGNTQRIVSKLNGSSAEYLFAISGTSKVSLNLYDGDTSVRLSVDNSATISTATWYHVATTYDGSGTLGGIKVYVNAALNTQGTSSAGSYTAMHNTANDVEVGAWISNSTYFNGKIDEVAIIPSELSQAQITAIYNSGFPASLSSYSPVGYWRMGDNDGGSGTNITDQGSGSNNGTLTNGPTFSTSVPS